HGGADRPARRHIGRIFAARHPARLAAPPGCGRLGLGNQRLRLGDQRCPRCLARGSVGVHGSDADGNGRVCDRGADVRAAGASGARVERRDYSMTNDDRSSVYVGVFLLSCAALLLEVALTRLFSFTLWYHFAYMTIGVALLGYG